jgi:hypothetical protein
MRFVLLVAGGCKGGAGRALKKDPPFRRHQQAGTAYVIVIGPA